MKKVKIKHKATGTVKMAYYIPEGRNAKVTAAGGTIRVSNGVAVMEPNGEARIITPGQLHRDWVAASDFGMPCGATPSAAQTLIRPAGEGDWTVIDTEPGAVAEEPAPAHPEPEQPAPVIEEERTLGTAGPADGGEAAPASDFPEPSQPAPVIEEERTLGIAGPADEGEAAPASDFPEPSQPEAADSEGDESEDSSDSMF